MNCVEEVLNWKLRWGSTDRIDPGTRQMFGMESSLELMKAYGLDLYGEHILRKTHCKT